MNPDRLKPLFGWRGAICDSDLAPTTRHVALTLSLHMNERGGSCFPGATRLAGETGLSVRAVRTHLSVLVDEGWLAVTPSGGTNENGRPRGGRGIANVYSAQVPDGEPDAPKGEPGAGNDVPHSVPDEEPDDTRLTGKGEPDDTKGCTSFTPVLHEDVSNPPIVPPEDSGVHVEGRDPAPNGAHEKSRGSQKPKARQLPDDFHVDESMRSWAQREAPHVNVDFQTDQFSDHHAAKGSTFVDWRRAWQTWVRNAAKWDRPMAATNAPSGLPWEA